MDAEQIEFLISQYVDGTLPAGDREFVDQLIERDAEARTLLASHQKLQAAIGALPSMPALQWDRLADQISRTVHAQTPEIGTTPAERAALDVSDSLPMPWVTTARWRTARRVALVAAAIVVTFTVASKTLLTSNPQSVAVRPIPLTEVSGPSIEVASRPATIEISVGAPTGFAALRDSDDGTVISRPSRVVIASGLVNAQDIPASPF